MAEPLPNNPCIACDGTGDDGSGFCVGCLGTGYRMDTGLHIFLKKLFDDTMDKLIDIKEKVDEIMEKLNEA